MEISTFIDWISVTHKWQGEHLPETANRDYTDSKAHNGYTLGKKYLSGVIEMFNPSRPDMGVHIIYSGKALNRVCEQSGLTRDEILLHHINNGGRASRIDYTVDIIDSGLSIDDLWQALENGNAKTKSSHSRSQDGHGKGYTLYVGSRKTRKKMLRIYDKGKEQEQWQGVDWKRIELETRTEIARNSCDMYIRDGMKSSTIHSMIAGVCDFPENPLWARILQSEASKIPVGTTGDGNTEKWLMTQVAPALARVLSYDSSFLSKFMSEVNFQIHKNIEKEQPQ